MTSREEKFQPNLERQQSSGAVLNLSLSQGTIDQILAETSSLVDFASENNIPPVESSGIIPVAPVGFSAELSSLEADLQHAIPHSFRIDTDSVQVFPAFKQNLTSNTPQCSVSAPMGLPSTSLMNNIPPYLLPLQNYQENANIPEQNQSPVPLKPVETTVLSTGAQRPLQVCVQPVGLAMTSNENKADNPCSSRTAQEETDSVLGPKDGAGVPAISPVAPVSTVADFPSNTAYPGPFGFQIFFSKAQEAEAKKTISYIFSPDENKLYVRMRVHCPVHFKTEKKPPSGTRIRAMAIYSRPQDVGDVVKRCMNHTMEDKDHLDFADHLVRCHNQGAQYEEVGTSKRHSVTIPLEDPPAGSEYITGIYEFMCFSSCCGTINRRPTQLLFTLENCGEIVGRQVVELRICACPGRDIVLSDGNANSIPGSKRKYKQNEKTEKVTQFTTLEPLVKKTRDNEIYTVQVRGRELYKIVMTIIRNYEVCRQYEELVSLMRQEQNRVLPETPEPKPQESVVAMGGGAGVGVRGTVMSDELQPDSSVAEWLALLDLSQYVGRFAAMGFQRMEDLEGHLDLETLEAMEMPQEDRERLYSSFIQWRSKTEYRALSSLSTLSGSQGLSGSSLGAGEPQGSVGFGGYRIAKTTVRATYKVPKKRVGINSKILEKMGDV